MLTFRKAMDTFTKAMGTFRKEMGTFRNAMGTFGKAMMSFNCDFWVAMAIGDCQSPMGSVGLVMVSFAMALGTFRQTIDETNWMAIYTIGLMLNLVSICFELV